MHAMRDAITSRCVIAQKKRSDESITASCDSYKFNFKNMKNQTETEYPRHLLLSYPTAYRGVRAFYLLCLEMTKCSNRFYLKHRVVIEISKQWKMRKY